MDLDDALKRRGITILENEQNALIGAYDSTTDEKAPTGLVFDKFEQEDEGKPWTQTKYVPEETFYDETVVSVKEREAKDNSETLRDICATMDYKLLGINQEIHIIKQQIVDLSSEATARNCNPGIAYSTGDASHTVDSSTVTEVNDDAELIKIWEKMAGPGFEAAAENPFDPDSIIILDGDGEEYIGYGYENLPEPLVVFDNGGNSTGLGTDGSGPFIGNGRFDITVPASTHQSRDLGGDLFYPGAGVAPWASNTSLTGSAAHNRCVEIKEEIDILYSQIIKKRIEKVYIRDKLNILKDNKSEKELQYWGMQNTISEITTRQSKNITAINVIEELDSVEIAAPQGLIGWFDAGYNSSYYGTGTTWYDLSELEEDIDLRSHGRDPIIPVFIDDLINEKRSRWQFDGIDDHIDIQQFTAGSPYVRGNRLGSESNPVANTVTIEIFAKLQIDLDVEDSDGYILFGFEQYSVWTGPLRGDGTPFALGFNTGNGDIYGLRAASVDRMKLNNNFIHYVFEMRSDVSYTNNKIYINGNLQSGSKIGQIGTERVQERHFTNEIVIAGWGSNHHIGDSNLYRMPMELSLVRIYDRALEQTEITSLYDMLSDRFS